MSQHTHDELIDAYNRGQVEGYSKGFHAGKEAIIESKAGHWSLNVAAGTIVAALIWTSGWLIIEAVQAVAGLIS